jgi:NADH-quinone oxidoreductase subunit M
MVSNILSVMLFTPAVVAFLMMFIPGRHKTVIKSLALAASAVPLLLSVQLYAQFDPSTAAFQFKERIMWIDAFNIEYFLGLDGISITLVILSSLLCSVALLVSWNIDEMTKGYFCLFLLLETGILGTFMALDLFLFFVFWELTLLPMYFLIGIWGGPRKEYAAIKFFLYTMFGSVLMLLGIIALYFQAGGTFAMPELMSQEYPIGFQKVLYLLFAIGFAIKIPVFPFHTWLPDAHVEAPTPISVILAGILLKMGSYGFYRIAFPFFPDAAAAFAWGLGLLGVINVIYGSLCAMAQQDLKKLVAYSSIGHMGYMLLGMASFVEIGLVGGHFQMFTHGLSSGLLFMLVGVVYDRAHHRNIDGFGGLASQMPVYAGFMMVATFAGLGLPGLAPFISEVFSFLGAFYSETTRLFAIIGIFGILLTAGYMLWMYQRIFFEEPNPKYSDLPDINGREMTAAIPLVVLIVVLGIYPMAYIELVNESIIHLQQMIPS